MKNYLNLIRKKYAVISYVAISFVISSLFISYHLISKEYQKYKKDHDKLSKIYNKTAREELKRKMDEVLDYISYQQKRENHQIKEDLKNHVKEFSIVINNIYQKNKHKGIQYTQLLIQNYIKNVKFNNGRGYYFAIDFSGKAISHGGPLNLEGTNLLKNAKTAPIIEKMIKKVNKDQEGFFQYKWYNPIKHKGKYERKISYIKEFRPLNLFFGTGEYLTYMNESLKKEVKNRIETLKIIGNGKAKVYPYKMNIPESKELESNPNIVKLSHIYAPWNWQIVLSIDTENFDKSIIKNKKNETISKLKNNVIFIGLVTLTLIIILGVPFIAAINSLNETEELKSELENIFKFSGDIFFTLDDEGNILKSNQIAMTFYSFSPQTNLKNYLDDGDYQNLIYLLKKRKGNIIKHFKTTHINLYLAFSISFIPDKNSTQKKQALIIARDLTEQHKKEETLLYMQKKAKIDRDIKNTFMNNIGHEIKTPVNAIQGLANILRNETNPISIKKYTRIIQKNSIKLTQVIDKILDISRTDQEGPNQFFRKINLNQIVKDIITENNEYYFDKNIQIKTDFTGLKHTNYIGDEFLISKLFNYVLENAYKFSSTGEIFVTLKAKQKKEHSYNIDFIVKNPTFSKEANTQQKVMAPFQQKDTSASRKYGGVGLGLTLAKDIAKKMKGEILIENLEKVTQVSVNFELCKSSTPVDFKNDTDGLSLDLIF